MLIADHGRVNCIIYKNLRNTFPPYVYTMHLWKKLACDQDERNLANLDRDTYKINITGMPISYKMPVF